MGKKPFKTYEETQQALREQECGPYTKEEYYDFCKTPEGSRFPTNPFGKFNVAINWKDFLGTTPYATLDEAKKAIQRLPDDIRPKTRKEYIDNWRNGNGFRNYAPGLPARPNEVYPPESGQTFDWKDFLGTKKYTTFREVCEALDNLDPRPKTLNEFKKNWNTGHKYRQQDPRIPLNMGDTFVFEGPEEWDVRKAFPR